MKLLLLFALSRLTDLLTTYLVIKDYGGYQIEANPFIRNLLITNGFFGFTLLNLTAITIIALFIKYFSRSKLSMNALKLITVVFFLTSTSNLAVFLLGKFIV